MLHNLQKTGDGILWFVVDVGQARGCRSGIRPTDGTAFFRSELLGRNLWLPQENILLSQPQPQQTSDAWGFNYTVLFDEANLGQCSLINTSLKLKYTVFCITLLARRYSRTSWFSSLSVFKIWDYILFLYNLSLSAPKCKETLTVVIKQEGTVGAAVNGINETIDSITNHSLFLVAK